MLLLSVLRRSPPLPLLDFGSGPGRSLPPFSRSVVVCSLRRSAWGVFWLALRLCVFVLPASWRFSSSRSSAYVGGLPPSFDHPPFLLLQVSGDPPFFLSTPLLLKFLIALRFLLRANCHFLRWAFFLLIPVLLRPPFLCCVL